MTYCLNSSLKSSKLLFFLSPVFLFLPIFLPTGSDLSARLLTTSASVAVRFSSNRETGLYNLPRSDVSSSGNENGYMYTYIFENTSNYLLFNLKFYFMSHYSNIININEFDSR